MENNRLINCTDIHQGHPQKEIRDFLSMQLVLLFETECKNKKLFISTNDFPNSFEWAKADAREQIKYFERYIENLNSRQAINQLITNNNWNEYDVSDYVYNNTGYKLGMNFIGTLEEYEVLYKNLS